MKKINKILLIFALCFLKNTIGQSKKYTADWKSLDSRPVAQWFEDAKFGIFIHWGPYSVPSWSPKGTYEEWYLKWFTSKSIFGNGSFSGEEIPVFHKKTVLKIRKTTKDHIKRIVVVSVPTIGERTLYHGAYLVFCAMIGHLGDQAMSVHQALISIESFGFISASAFGIAAFTLSAQKIGAQEPQEALKSVKRTIVLGGITLSLFGILLVVFGEFIISQFVSSGESVSLGYSCMLVAAFAQPMMAYVEIWSAAFRGAGNTKTPMVAAFIGPTIVRLSSCYLLAFHYDMGLVGIWVGSTIDWVFRTLFFFYKKSCLTEGSRSV